MSTPQFDIYLRNNLTYERLERLDVYSELTIVKRFNKTGTWNLEVPTDANIAQFISPDVGIIVYRDGVPLFSGPCNTDYEETATSIQMSGTDDNVLLETPARPTPSLANGPYPDEFDVTTGIATTIMRSLVNRNIGPSAPAAWKIAALSLATDPVIGSTITSRARFDPLIILLAELASTPIATGLGFDIVQSPTVANTVTFSIYVPRDKHLDTVFSIDLHTAQDYKRTHTVPGANYFIVAGGDDFGANRTVVEDGDAASIAAVGRRVAEFVDKRGVTDIGELNQELAQLMATVITQDTVDITPTDFSNLEFGTDYDLGDYVTAVVKGVSYSRLIREIEINFKPDTGPVVKVLVADPFGTGDELASRHLSTLEDRISNIERNFNVPDDSIIEAMLHPTMKWYPGDMKITARAAAQPGWYLCNGDSLSRSVYSRLFTAINTEYGPGDGITTFNVPNVVNKYVIGAGSTVGLGNSGGLPAVDISHNHTGNTLSWPHGHNHSHTVNSHTHEPGNYKADGTSEAVDNDVRDLQDTGSGSHVGGENHAHELHDIPITGTSASSTPGTNSDESSVSTAGSWTGTTGPGGSVISLLFSCVGVNFEIYTGVV